VRSPGRPSGVLTWRKPAHLPLRPAGYRVYRNGKVVGQTGVAVRRLRVSFVPGRAVTFMVRVALRTGAVVPCAGRLTQTIKWRPPTPPVDLVAQPHTDSVTLLWQPAQTGDGKLNGYRVYRDGKPFRDAKATTLTIVLPPLRTYSMTVAAIDRLVHHSIILEMNTESYRRKSAETKLRRKPTGSAEKASLAETSPAAEVP